MIEKQWLQKLAQQGFTDLTVCPLREANMDLGEHTHEEHTVHVILKGELILIDKNGVQKLRKGERFEIKAGTTHKAKTGPEGCTMIVGVKAHHD